MLIVVNNPMGACVCHVMGSDNITSGKFVTAIKVANIFKVKKQVCKTPALLWFNSTAIWPHIEVPLGNLPLVCPISV